MLSLEQYKNYRKRGQCFFTDRERNRDHIFVFRKSSLPFWEMDIETYMLEQTLKKHIDLLLKSILRGYPDVSFPDIPDILPQLNLPQIMQGCHVTLITRSTLLSSQFELYVYTKTAPLLEILNVVSPNGKEGYALLSRGEYYGKRCDMEFNMTYEEHCAKQGFKPHKQIRLWQVLAVDSNILSMNENDRIYLEKRLSKESLTFLDVLADERDAEMGNIPKNRLHA